MNSSTLGLFVTVMELQLEHVLDGGWIDDGFGGFAALAFELPIGLHCCYILLMPTL